ncbi:MAG: class I SAM-dependent methyltransferase [Chloroflexota bacterium]
MLLVDPHAAEDAHHSEGAHGADERRGSDNRAQVAFHDDPADAEFEIERPDGTTALYKWVMQEKFRRSVSGLDSPLTRVTALTVCGGSGMDGELLAAAGARVITSDLSLGAARRALERARRHGVDLNPLVADVENLPFADRSIDLVYVHDGLHHLVAPTVGLKEMLRVSRNAVSVTEPADAVATRLAMRVGAAKAREPAGNLVARLSYQDVRRAVIESGFSRVSGGRYFLYYSHKPGPPSRILSRTPLLQTTQALWHGLNAVAAGVGNKLALVAQR